MAFELIHTSVPEGIRPGSSGFCIAAYTNGLAANIALQLENLSAYKPYFPHYDENATNNPVAYSHYASSASGETIHILSRICFCGLDYTKRSNKLAHHIVICNHELSNLQTDPAAVFRQENLFRSTWEGKPQLFQRQCQINSRTTRLPRAVTWEKYAGDAGWAGVLAQSFLDHSSTRQAYVVFDPLKHPDTLGLLEEALLLLPEDKRWEVNFNTYFTHLPVGLSCDWRFCVPDSEALKNARRVPGTLIIDLTSPLPPAPNSELAAIARTRSLPVIPTFEVKLPSPFSFPGAMGQASQNLFISAQQSATNDQSNPKQDTDRPFEQKLASFAQKNKQTALISILVAASVIITIIVVAYLYFIVFAEHNNPPEGDKTVSHSETPPGGLSEGPSKQNKNDSPTAHLESAQQSTAVATSQQNPIVLTNVTQQRNPNSANDEKNTLKDDAIHRVTGNTTTANQPVKSSDNLSAEDLKPQLTSKTSLTPCSNRIGVERGERVPALELDQRTLWTQRIPILLSKGGSSITLDILSPEDKVCAVQIAGEQKTIADDIAYDYQGGGLTPRKDKYKYSIKKLENDSLQIVNKSPDDTPRYMLTGIYTSDRNEKISEIPFLWQSNKSMFPDEDDSFVTIEINNNQLTFQYQFSEQENNWVREASPKFPAMSLLVGNITIPLKFKGNHFITEAIPYKSFDALTVLNNEMKFIELLALPENRKKITDYYSENEKSEKVPEWVSLVKNDQPINNLLFQIPLKSFLIDDAIKKKANELLPKHALESPEKPLIPENQEILTAFRNFKVWIVFSGDPQKPMKYINAIEVK